MKKVFCVFVFILASYYGKSQKIKNESLPVDSFSVNTKKGEMCFLWSVKDKALINYFEVQCSTDGKIFKTIAYVLGPDPQRASVCEYIQHVESTQKASCFYRLLCISNNGSEWTSNAIVENK
ncbi:MAG: hypothetical protein WDM71_06465 [Ferruginibacter sp.]